MCIRDRGIGIDKEAEGYLVSVHYLRSGEEVKMDFIQSQGSTVYEALQNLTLQTGDVYKRQAILFAAA